MTFMVYTNYVPSFMLLSESTQNCLFLRLRSSIKSIATYAQGQSHDSLSGQVEFVPSLSDFRIGAIEIWMF